MGPSAAEWLVPEPVNEIEVSSEIPFAPPTPTPVVIVLSLLQKVLLYEDLHLKLIELKVQVLLIFLLLVSSIYLLRH